MTFFWQNPMRIKHAVWPTEVPPVPTAMWNQSDWDRFAERYRPKWYTGGIHDAEAYRKAGFWYSLSLREKRGQNPTRVTVGAHKSIPPNLRRNPKSKYAHKLPDGTKVRVYLSDEPVTDKWTVVIRSPEWDASAKRGFVSMLGMSDAPTHPQGFSQFTEGMEGSHLGRKVAWSDVPEHLRKHIAYRLT